jgi:hypothetical protein
VVRSESARSLEQEPRSRRVAGQRAERHGRSRLHLRPHRGKSRIYPDEGVFMSLGWLTFVQ